MTGRSKPALIFCDVDGTLIEPSEEITPLFGELRDLVRRENLRFTIASGRSTRTMRKFLDALEVTEPFIINNGAGARQGGEVLWDTTFPAALTRDVIRKADEMDMAIFMVFGDEELVYRHNAYVQYDIDHFGRYNRFYIPLESEWPTLRFERLMLTDPMKPGRIHELLPALEPYADQLQIVQYDDRHMDVMAKGVSKGQAVRRIAQMHGIDPNDVLVIGDGNNDLEMMRAAGMKAAVGNARPVVKEAANYVCEGTYTRGVLEAVQHFLAG